MAVPQSANVKQTTFQFNRPRYGSDAISSRSSSESNSPPRSPGLLAELEEEEEEEDIGFGARGLRSRERGGDHKVYDTQLQQEDEPPRSGEVKSPSYPLGPALIFEPNVYLYSEPNAELASQFDVIINVAREVLNPFKDGANTDGVILPNSPIPQTACTDVSFKTAFEETPLSPAPLSKREPEYVHMPWDHNTPILGDLPALVELISQRSDEGKKILVHCQCGVSRSATLLIAYSMYKHPEQSMQDAYSAVKAKSRWIGPNMSLIYQLTDWKKRIGSDAPKTAFGGWRGGGGSGSSGAGGSMGSGGLGRGGRNGRDTDTDAESMTEPLTAPLPDRRTSPPRSPLANSKAERHKPQMVRTRSENGGFLSSVLPGPSSAPPGMCSIPGSERLSWPDGDAKLRRPSSPELQRESWLDSSRNYEPLEPTRMQPPPPVQQSQCLPKANRYSIEKLDFRIPGQFETDLDENLNVPPTPSILSPRNSGSWPTPIAPRRITQWNGFFADPRSPTERGSTSPVIRNIFDVL
jgi:tyrosine-protein phosphatase